MFNAHYKIQMYQLCCFTVLDAITSSSLNRIVTILNTWKLRRLRLSESFSFYYGKSLPATDKWRSKYKNIGPDCHEMDLNSGLTPKRNSYWHLKFGGWDFTHTFNRHEKRISKYKNSWHRIELNWCWFELDNWRSCC